MNDYLFIYVGFSYDYYDILLERVSHHHENVFQSKYPANCANIFKSTLYRILKKLPGRYFRHCSYMMLLDRQAVDQIKLHKNVCFIIWAGLLDKTGIGFISWLKEKIPGCMAVCVFTDTIDHYHKFNPRFNLESIRSSCNLVVSYNEKDCVNHSLILNRPMLYYFDQRDSIDFDVFFIGTDKGRLEQVVHVYDVCEKNGLNCKFYLIGVPAAKQIHRKGIYYIKHNMKYKDVLAKARKAKCILNIIQKGASGITLRDYEAIGMNKFLITNNRSLFSSVFYTEEKVIDYDNINQEIKKVNNDPGAADWNGKETYNALNYFKWLSSQLAQ